MNSQKNYQNNGDTATLLNSQLKLDEKQKKVIEYLVDKEKYERTDAANILKKYGIDEVELKFEEPQEGKLDFEVDEINIDSASRVIFIIRVDKFLEREFKKFYQNANEVKKVLEERKEVYLEHLSELGFEEYFKQEAERLFVDDKQMKNIALLMAEKKIDIYDHSEGQTRQIEGALLGGMDGYRVSKKRFDDIKQDDFANFQEYQDHLKDLKDKKTRLIELQRSIEFDWRTLKDRQWSGMWKWLRNDEMEKAVKAELRKLGAMEPIIKRLAKEYFDTLPKTTQIELEDVEKCVSGKVNGWENELLFDDMKTWTDEQWKQYLPKEKYSPYKHNRERYNNASLGELQLKKIDKHTDRESSYYRHENDFYQNIVEQKPETFDPKNIRDYCYHCIKSDKGEADFKLILKTKLRLIYTCSRCENTEIFFDILEWKKT